MPYIEAGTQSSPKALTQAARLNADTSNFPKNPPAPKPAESLIYIYTVSRLQFHVEHFLLGHFTLEGCEPGERYRQARPPIRDPYPQLVPDVFSVGRDAYDYHPGRRVAQDICDASNPYLDQKVEDFGKQNSFYDTQEGTAYSKFGVFWSANNPPSEEELKAAETRRDRTRVKSIRKMDELYAANPSQALAQIKPEHREALQALGEERPWYRAMQPKHSCPNCGEQIPAGRLYHRDADGDLCVIGQEGWKAAVQAGKRKYEDVPEDMKWRETRRNPGARRPGEEAA